MGFYTTAACYREGPHPPHVTGDELADFCQRVIEMDIIEPDVTWSLQLRYGRAIDQDDKSTLREKKISNVISVMQPYPWDVSATKMTPAGVMQQLRQPPPPSGRTLLDTLLQREAPSQTIYRAMIAFGYLRDEYSHTLQHELEGNWLFLCELFLHINIVEIFDPEKMNRFEVGWMSLAVGGNGYPFPWTYEETLQRVREHPQLQALRDYCRWRWPASDQPVASEVFAARKLMGKYWSEPLDVPYDWYWTIQGCV